MKSYSTVLAGYPKLHEHIRQFPELYTGEYGWQTGKLFEDGGKRAKTQLLDHLRTLGPIAEHGAQQLLVHLFPQLGDLLRKDKYGGFNRERARGEQRVSLHEYLKRYTRSLCSKSPAYCRQARMSFSVRCG